MGLAIRPTWAEVSLNAFRHNLHAFRKVIPPEMKIMAVVKANAYGHGAPQIAKEALHHGVDYLAVATLEEALDLRRAGIQGPILVFGYTPPEGVGIAAAERITLSVYSEDVLNKFRSLSGISRPLPVHIKLDTGMGRFGLFEEDAAISFIEQALKISTIEVEALYTHFAAADETDKTFTHVQYERFSKIIQYFESRGIQFPLNHAGNSATAIEFPELSGRMIRLGISLYGHYPSKEVERGKINLQPVMQFKTRIVHLKSVPPETGISYGLTYRTNRQSLIATLPVGYADGYSRMLSGKAEVLVRGVKAPVVGLVCMDSCMIDVTDIPGVSLGDEVVLIGKQGDEEISAETIGELLQTVNYEIVCMVSNRVPRLYKSGH